MTWYWYNYIMCVRFSYHVCIYFVQSVYVFCVYMYNTEKIQWVFKIGARNTGNVQYVYTGSVRLTRCHMYILAACGSHAAINPTGHEPVPHAAGKYHTSRVRLHTRLVTDTTSEVPVAGRHP
jgi:hypothetical protein